METTGQIDTHNRAGESLSYGGKDVATGTIETIIEIRAQQAAEYITLNLSWPAPSDWGTNSFTLYQNGREIVPIIDQSAQFINRPWVVPVMVSPNDRIKLTATNASGATERAAAYLGIKGAPGNG